MTVLLECVDVYVSIYIYIKRLEYFGYRVHDYNSCSVHDKLCIGYRIMMGVHSYGYILSNTIMLITCMYMLPIRGTQRVGWRGQRYSNHVNINL